MHLLWALNQARVGSGPRDIRAQSQAQSLKALLVWCLHSLFILKRIPSFVYLPPFPKPAMGLIPSRSSGNLGTRPLRENMCKRDELVFEHRRQLRQSAHDNHQPTATWEACSAEVKNSIAEWPSVRLVGHSFIHSFIQVFCVPYMYQGQRHWAKCKQVKFLSLTQSVTGEYHPLAIKVKWVNVYEHTAHSKH